jgi:hypothetical protein
MKSEEMTADENNINEINVYKMTVDKMNADKMTWYLFLLESRTVEKEYFREKSQRQSSHVYVCVEF